MSRNRGVVYTKPGGVQLQDIADPKFENLQGRKIEHGVILKVIRPISADLLRAVCSFCHTANLTREAIAPCYFSATRMRERLQHGNLSKKEKRLERLEARFEDDQRFRREQVPEDTFPKVTPP